RRDWSRPTVRTGLRAIDELYRLQPPEFMVIGARTSMGKTSFTLDLALRFARNGARVDFFSLEDGQKQIVRRGIAKAPGIPLNKIKTAELSRDEIAECGEAVAMLKELPLTITDPQHLRITDEKHILGAVSASGAEIIFVDHLQKIQTQQDSRVYGLESV